MVIFGTRGVTYTTDRGRFHCPRCESPQDYMRQRTRRFFTLYFVPVLPLDVLGEYVECPVCRETFRDDVLHYDRETFESELSRALRGVLAVVLVSEAQENRPRLERVCEMSLMATGIEIDLAALEEEIASISPREGLVRELLSEVAGRLNAHGKEQVMRVACEVAFHDGLIARRELEVLQEVADTLQMSQANFRGVLAAVTEVQ